jgi:hypothetical protein
VCASSPLLLSEGNEGGKVRRKEEQVVELENVLVKIRTRADIKEGKIEGDERKVAKLTEETAEVFVCCLDPVRHG